SCTKNRCRERDEILNIVCFGNNTAMHAGIGCTPFELTFSRSTNHPSAISATTAMSKKE
ncbi:unnamed protein product, partial [Heterotrigona itama]